jgi:hypothetical protein
MESSSSPNVAESTQVIQSPEESPRACDPGSQAASKKAELAGLLTQARNVKEMIENFKAACECSTVSGHVAVRMAIGLQWLDSMLRQNKADIQNLQDKLK